MSSSGCSKCHQSNQMYITIANVDGESIPLCGNCKVLLDSNREIFDRTVSQENRSKFDIDATYGKEKEHRFLQIMSSSFEIKSDRQARRTGNVYVEYESRGKPGGIASTSAEFWAQEVDDDVYIIMPTKRMSDLVKMKLDRYGPTLGGDGKTSKGVLLRLSEMLKPVPEGE